MYVCTVRRYVSAVKLQVQKLGRVDGLYRNCTTIHRTVSLPQTVEASYSDHAVFSVLNFRNLLCICFQLGWGGGRGEEGVQKGVNTVNFRVYLVFDSAHSFALHLFT
jgi:hypothetical protein